MFKVNKNNQFGPKSWFNGSKNDDKLPKTVSADAIFGLFWAIFGQFSDRCAPQKCVSVIKCLARGEM